MDNRNHEEVNSEKKPPELPESFVPPRHWIGVEELKETYWTNPETKEKRGQEFFEKPIEYLDNLDRTDSKGIARRDFLTVMGASMAMASFACARRPVHKIIPYVVKPEEITPGIPNWYASTCNECSTGCGVLVKTREGRPIKLEGNPDHPMNEGTLCARGQASVLNLYDPDRLKTPLIRSRATGQIQESNWAEVDAAIQGKLKAIAAGSGRVRVLTETINSESTRTLIGDFLSAFRQGGLPIELDPLALEEIPQSQELSYGKAVNPHYRFDRAEILVSIGGDFLGAGNSSVEYSREWAEGRKLAGDPAQARLSKLITFEPMMTLTGANSDERYPIRPEDEVKVALALAYELIIQKKVSRFANNSAVNSALAGYAPQKVSTEIGLANGAATLKRIANELWGKRGKSLVVGGTLESKTKQALALQIAINFLNSALENEGATVDGTLNFRTAQSGFGAVSQLITEMKAGQVDALIIHKTNPAYTLPRVRVQLEEAIKKVPLVIVIAEHQSETALLADYILPDHHYLENWGDAKTGQGIFSLQQPTLSPIHSSRAFQDSLLTWGKAAQLSMGSRVAKAEGWYQYLQNLWKETHYAKAGAAGTFEVFWEGVLRQGVYLPKPSATQPSVRAFRDSSLAQLPKAGPSQYPPLSLVLYPKISMGDGRSANNAWLQEMPDPVSSITWDNYLNVSPELATQLALKNDDVIEVTSEEVSVQLPVHVQPGMHPAVVSAAIGYGRRSVGKVGNQTGVDVYPFVKVDGNRLVYSGLPAALKKTGKFYRLAATQWHTASENRPVINDITLAEYKKNPASANHTNPHLRLDEVPTMWPEHEYKGYRWGMAIDLNSCNGCSACVIACQAENNIPVVGREQVRVARQMHWLRIDRYYAGSPSNPDVVFQPMLCQHCENAPCETVCPVLATVHDDEGLNVQVYNRCVGTRYCQNNCPYKVRRFNFFDHWKAYEGTLNMVWNPDVTVRTRGIMEKCTFCVQRIRDVKDKAKDLDRKVIDGELKTACQQTCPTDAIVFGDINDPKSRVSLLRNGPRAFRALEVLNAKPSISYLTKVRNKAEGSHSHSSPSQQGAHHV